jgi:hypothetical protein
VATPAFAPNLCCKLPPLPSKQVPLPPIPAAVLDPLVTAIKDATKKINAFLDQVALKCPRE